MAATCPRCAASDKQHLHLRGPAFFADADVGGYDVLDPWRFRQKGGKRGKRASAHDRKQENSR